MARRAPLLQNDSKFAVIALQAQVEISSAFQTVGPSGLWVSTTAPIPFDENWKLWLGSIRENHLTDANLFLVAEAPSTTLSILDQENDKLKRDVYWFYLGILLSARLTTFDDPLLLTGATRDGHSDVREVGGVGTVTGAALVPGLRSQPVTVDSLARAGEIALALRDWGEVGGSWHFNHVLQIYASARGNTDPLERIHQFSRCVEGLISGETKRQFIARTETFIGPGWQKEMGSIYDVRSAVEHLREYEILEPGTRSSREDLLRKAAIMEHLSRHCLGHVLLTRSIWSHFSSPSALEGFWKLPLDERSKLWGPPINLASDMAEFCTQHIRDEDLGLK
jgi:hypothetical protein